MGRSGVPGDVERERSAFSLDGVKVKQASGFYHQPLDDAETESGSLAAWFGGEIGLKELSQDGGWNSRTVILNRDAYERELVFETVEIQVPVGGGIFEVGEFQRFVQSPGPNGDGVTLLGGLESIDAQVHQDLDQV